MITDRQSHFHPKFKRLFILYPRSMLSYKKNIRTLDLDVNRGDFFSILIPFVFRNSRGLINFNKQMLKRHSNTILRIRRQPLGVHRLMRRRYVHSDVINPLHMH